MTNAGEADTQNMHIRRALPVCFLLSLFVSSQADAQFRVAEPRRRARTFTSSSG